VHHITLRNLHKNGNSLRMLADSPESFRGSHTRILWLIAQQRSEIRHRHCRRWANFAQGTYG
jgi:hypothetical protein